MILETHKGPIFNPDGGPQPFFFPGSHSNCLRPWVIFTTDNGGPAAGLNNNMACNWPLRGVKNTLWEGGVRGTALAWSPTIQNPGRTSDALMHVTDWMPTILGAVNVSMSSSSSSSASSSSSSQVSGPGIAVLIFNKKNIYFSREE